MWRRSLLREHEREREYERESERERERFRSRFLAISFEYSCTTRSRTSWQRLNASAS